jgi:hypothetical protein
LVSNLKEALFNSMYLLGKTLCVLNMIYIYFCETG